MIKEYKKPYAHKETIPMKNWPKAPKMGTIQQEKSKLIAALLKVELLKRRKPTSNTFYFFFGFNVALSICVCLFAAFLVFWK